MEDKILLSDLLWACTDFCNDPTAEKKETVDKIVNSLKIVDYLPVSAKAVALGKIINNIYGDPNNAIECTISLCISRIIFGVLPYIVNLENDLDYEAFSPEVVDILYELEVVDKVLGFAGKDFARLDKMVCDTLNFSNIIRITDTMAFLSPESLQEFTKVMSEMKSELTPEKIEALRQIAIHGSPEWEAFVETMKETAADIVLSEEFDTVKEIITPSDNKKQEA